MYIDRGKTGTVEGGRHFHLSIDPLLAQDGDPWPHPLGNVRRGNILRRVKTDRNRQARISRVENAVEFLLRAFGVVTQRLHVEAKFRPGALQGDARFAEQHPPLRGNAQFIAGIRRADDPRQRIESHGPQAITHHGQVGTSDLQHGTEFFGEQHPQYIGRRAVTQRIEIQRNAAVGGKGHFGERGKEAAVTAVVVGENPPLRRQLLHGDKEGNQPLRFVDIRCFATGSVEHLRQRRPSQAIFTRPQVDQQQDGFTGVKLQLRRQCALRVLHRRKGGDDQRQRRNDLFLFSGLFPGGTHRQRILAHRDRNANLLAQVGDSAYRVKEPCIFARCSGRRHPVGREFDITNLFNTGGGDVGERLANGHAARGRCIEHRNRGAFAQCEGFTTQRAETHRCHRDIGYWCLPRPDHLVTCRQATDRTVAN